MQRECDREATYLAEDAKKGDPEDKQNGIPGGDEDAARFDDEWDEVESARSRCQSAYHDGIDLGESSVSWGQFLFELFLKEGDKASMPSDCWSTPNERDESTCSTQYMLFCSITPSSSDHHSMTPSPCDTRIKYRYLTHLDFV